jgi:hypothetical protein
MEDYMMIKKKSKLMKSIIITVAILMITLFNQIQTFGQSSAFCSGTCPGGCAMMGFDAASCVSAGCLCVCWGWFDDEPNDPYINFTNCDLLIPE